jgi:hypothetical protein
MVKFEKLKNGKRGKERLRERAKRNCFYRGWSSGDG